MVKAIAVENLSYTYPDGTPGLKGVSFSVGAGEFVAVLGANGTGKSTLLMTLMGILRGQGEIRIFDIVLDAKTIKTLRRKMNLLFQDPDDQLFSPTVFDDVAFGPINLGLSDDEVRLRVSRALESVRLTGFERRCPHHLSYGEKKKVAIASIISMAPEILLLDEPTGGLDPRSATELINILDDLKQKGNTILVTTHDLHLASELADKVIILNEMKSIATEGTPEEVLKNRQLLLANNLIHEHRHKHKAIVHTHVHEHEHHHIHEHNVQTD